MSNCSRFAASNEKKESAESFPSAITNVVKWDDLLRSDSSLVGGLGVAHMDWLKVTETVPTSGWRSTNSSDWQYPTISRWFPVAIFLQAASDASYITNVESSKIFKLRTRSALKPGVVSSRISGYVFIWGPEIVPSSHYFCRVVVETAGELFWKG